MDDAERNDERHRPRARWTATDQSSAISEGCQSRNYFAQRNVMLSRAVSC